MAEGLELVAQLMNIAAVTAPKTRGQDFVRTKIITGDEVKKLGEAMIAYGEKIGNRRFDREAGNVLKSEAVLLVGLKDAAAAGLDCGACGYPNCQALEAQTRHEGQYRGPLCAFRLLDMGIALGSAVKVAGLLNVDNRIMNRIGIVVRAMQLVDWDFVQGIPLSATAKSVYFDRP
jgi:uncharacterized ferredoxin-like protein